MDQLKFAPVTLVVESGFFTKLSELKLNEFKLDASRTTVRGYMVAPLRLNKFYDKPVVILDHDAFAPRGLEDGNLWLRGSLHNVNTIEEFKAVDKQQFLKDAGHDVLERIRADPKPTFTTLNPFLLLTFSDLKNFKFYYWFAYPALNLTWFIEEKAAVLRQAGEAALALQPLPNDLFYADGDRYVFVDTSLNRLPSAQLKNHLYVLAHSGVGSIALTVLKAGDLDRLYTFKLRLDAKFDRNATPQIVGWERQATGKLGPKLADLGSLINPILLAEQAVDLNLKLMKWRVAPDLNLDLIKKQRVLLLGAGTLGNYVARALMGWGVRKITFVDNGKVSYSNPVRQPLFLFKDCFSDGGQGEWKATRAAEALREVFPGVDSAGFNLDVPMVGHADDDEAAQRANYDQLCHLFDEHDVVFLLMDSRESRWLPTVLGLAKNKIVLNAALGFDSFLVLRHGALKDDADYDGRLGCYYCNDVVAPDDSLTDRTLDQMCTVTRPGVALMASALAVELMVSVLQHPLGVHAPHDTPPASSSLGEVPHQIRGFLRNFQQSKLCSPSFKQCSACSMAVVTRYNDEGWGFVKKCINQSKYLEQVSGLAQLQQEAELGALAMLQDMELSDDEHEWLS
jgi:ubiquitin-like modifier-activating enzyme ATG7